MFPVQTYGMPELSGNTEHKRGSTTCCSPAVSRWSLRDTLVQKQRRREGGRERITAPQSTVFSVPGEAVVVVVVGCWPVFEAVMTTTPPQDRRHTEGDYELQFSVSSPPGGGARAGRGEELLPACHSWLHASVLSAVLSDSFSSLSPYYLCLFL